ncbi:hypothetical protein RQP46_006146 [Phenoliferia psychrophenolica]
MKSFTPLTLSISLALLSTSALAASHDGQEEAAFPLAGASLLVVAPANGTAPSNSSSSSNTTAAPVEYNGTALWFTEGGAMGACGTYSTDDDLVVGLSSEFWPNTSVISPLCGQYLKITYPTTGKSIVALIADAAGKNYTTLTQAAFKSFAPLDIGELLVTFSFLNSSMLTNATSTANSTVAAAVASALPASAVPQVAVSTAAATNAANVNNVAQALALPVATPTAVEAAAASAKALAASAASAASSSSAAAAIASANAAQKLNAENAASSSSAAAAQASQDAATAAASQAASQAKQAAASAAAAASSKAAAAAAKASQDAAAAVAAATKTADALLGQVTGAVGSAVKTYTGGFATYYLQNGVAGACGKVNPDSALIIAIDSAMYANGANCGRSITITRTDTGQSVTATVADECPTCENGTSLDLSEGAFNKIATVAEGMVPMSWHFNN